MKLKDLTVELSGNDNNRIRSVNIGPLSDGLNFVYGERGAGKSTIRNLVSDLLSGSADQNSRYPRAHTPNGVPSTRCGSIGLEVECESGRFRISRDKFGKLETARVGSGGTRSLLESAQTPIRQDRELADSLSFVSFSSSPKTHERLYRTLQNRLQVPLGPEAVSNESNSHRISQERAELQARIEVLQRQLVDLETNRNSLSLSPIASSGDLDRQIGELTLRLSEFDPIRIRTEMDSLKQEATRLRAEIESATAVVRNATPSRYLPTLYRLLGEIDQQIREVRVVQSNVQRHRVRLKQEMEQLGALTIDETNHPYHRAREILHQIESRIDNADTRGDQWLEDHGTVDAQQVSRFIDQTCISLRSDLQLLCDELSGQYRELHNRSAAIELKELRHNYDHLSELIQKLLSRRGSVLAEIQSVDPAGAELISRADPEFCGIATSSGYLAARQKFLGAIDTPATHVVRDTSLQQQQLAALEARMATLQAPHSHSEMETARISREISELSARKSSLSMAWETERQEKLSRIDSQIRSLQTEIQTLTFQRDQLSVRSVEPNSLLKTACGILQQLTAGEYTRVWLSSTKASFDVQDRNNRVTSVETFLERGLSQLVQLAIVLAANENNTAVLEAPLVFDDLFAELKKERVDPTLETLASWCHQNHKQIVLLTQHRFLADRTRDYPVWEIETPFYDYATSHSNGVTHTAVNSLHTTSVSPATVTSHVAASTLNPTRPHVAVSTGHVAPSMKQPGPATPLLEPWQQEVYVGMPVAEYPHSPMSRPYPLSKYPRTTDRDRHSGSSTFEYHELNTQPEIHVDTSNVYGTGSVEVNSHRHTGPVSPSAIGDRYQPTTIKESTRIETLTLFESAQHRCLENFRVNTVGEFLLLDPQTDESEFTACYLAGQSLEHLQAAVWLMCWVPGLAGNDAQALVACGISDPQHLLTSNADNLFERLARFLRSPDGRKFGSSGENPSRETVRNWQHRLRNNRSYRHQRRPRPSRAHRSRSDRHVLRAFSPGERGEELRAGEERRNERTQREALRREMPTRSRMRTPEPREPRESSYEPRERRRSQRKPAAVRQSAVRQSLTSLNETEASVSEPKPSSSKSKAGSSKLRFYLELTDHIEAAPSIGPKTGARFEAIGVYTIADFLKMTAESMAEKLDYKRLNANLLRQWQNQSRLVCRIPNLRGHDAQLLVGCDIIEPEELASMRPEALFAKIAPFSDTKEGLKIIRNGKKPDLAEITDWISFAQHNRSLQAA